MRNVLNITIAIYFGFTWKCIRMVGSSGETTPHDSDCEILEPEIEVITLLDSDDEENARKAGKEYTVRSESDDFTIIFQSRKAAKKFSQPIANALKYVSGDLLFVVRTVSEEMVRMEAYAPSWSNKPDKLENYKRIFKKLQSFFSGDSASYKQNDNLGTIQISIFAILMFIISLYIAYTFRSWLCIFCLELLHFLSEFLVNYLMRILITLVIILILLSDPLYDMVPNKKLYLTFGLAIFPFYMYWTWITTFGVEYFSYSYKFLKTLSLRSIYLVVLGFIYKYIWQSKYDLLKLISLLAAFKISFYFFELFTDVLDLSIIFFKELLMRFCIAVGMGTLFVISFIRSINNKSEHFSTIIIGLFTLFIFWSNLTNLVLEFYDFFYRLCKNVGFELVLLFAFLYLTKQNIGKVSQKRIVNYTFSFLMIVKIFCVLSESYNYNLYSVGFQTCMLLVLHFILICMNSQEEVKIMVHLTFFFVQIFSLFGNHSPLLAMYLAIVPQSVIFGLAIYNFLKSKSEKFVSNAVFFVAIIIASVEFLYVHILQ